MRTLAATIGIALLLLTLSVQGFAQQDDSQAIYRVSLPNKTWALDIPASILKTDLQNVQPNKLPFWIPTLSENLSDDGREYSLLLFHRFGDKNHPNLATLTVRLKPAQAPGGASELRGFVLKTLSTKAEVKQNSIKTWEHNQIPVARYSGKRDFDGGNIYTGPIPRTEFGPRSLEGYFVKDDIWIIVTFTASPFEAEEENLFYSLLDAAKFVDTSAPSSSLDYYHRGRVLFLAKDYARAVEALNTAFTLEQSERKLNLESWRDLIRKLADSNGLLVNRARAKEVLEYGIQEDPTNYSFHMGLARLNAAQGEVDNTLASLEKAFFYMKQATPKVWLPDLKYDQAFARYLKIERFRKAVEAMRK